MKKKITYFLFLSLLVASCSPSEKKETNIDFYSTDLFKDVQLHAIFPDSKSFADCTSKKDLAETVALYESQKSSPGFDLKKFVEDNFDLPIIPQSKFISDTTQSMQEHITSLWSVLQRDADKYNPNSSLIPLPNSYIVPGGRFAEIYYWDSYFTMLGLQAQGRYDIMKNMIDNFAFLIDSLGFIPNGNRNYYVGRSQPPFFAVMVSVLEEKDTVASSHYLPMFQKEYAFWMHGADQLKKPGDVVEHVVMMPDGTILNRYFDKIAQPRPEAYKEDYNLAQKSSGSKEELYTHLRAAAESGIDFSTRWFREGSGLESIHTTDFIA
ncbi:MAG TPA: trehalase family glycosidase, partial [Cyclobacteriaceae bacterium]|nr:trehalase family glycosidase [Cyclobacteriaceae bacterium]